MKKTLSRILALLVALTVLLAPAALAEEYNMAVLSLGNFDITIDGEEIFLPVTLDLLLGADPEAARGSAAAQLRVDDLVAGMVSGVVEDDQLKVHISGMDYSLFASLDDLLAELEPEVREELELFLADPAVFFESPDISSVFPDAEKEALLKALGVVLTEEGSATVEAFDESISATKSTLTTARMTANQILEVVQTAAPSLTPVIGDFFSLLSENELWDELTLSAGGAVYANDTDTILDMNLTLEADGDTLVVPFFYANRNTGTEEFSECSSLLVDGDYSIRFDYSDIDTESAAAFEFSVTQTDIATNEVELSVSIAFDAASISDASSAYFTMSLSSYDEFVTFYIDYNNDPSSEAGVSCAFKMDSNVEGAPLTFLLAYSGSNAVETGDGPCWGGALVIELNENDQTVFSAFMDTTLTLGMLPEGELLTLEPGSIDMVNVTDEQLEALSNDLQTPLLQLLGTLMQNETIAGLMSGMM